MGRFTRILPISIFIIVGLLLVGDALSNKVLLYGRDTVSHDYILSYYGWQVVRHNAVIPLWIPYLFCGIPFIGSFAFCPFYPTNILSAFLPFPLVFNLQYFIALLIAGLTFYYSCRSFGLSEVSAIFGGVVFMSSGHLVSLIHPGHLQKVQAIIWLPLVIGSANFYLQRQETKYLLIGGTGLALQILASHLQIFYYTVQILGLFFLFAFIADAITVRNFIQKVLIPVVLMLLIGLFLSSVQLLPSLEMAGESNRSPCVPYKEAIAGSFPPEELPELLFPRFVGDSTEKGYGQYQGRWKERLVTDYVGAGVWVFAIIGLFAGHNRWRWFFAILFLLSMALACGKFSPLYRFFYEHVPGYNKFRSPATIMVVMTFSLVTLSALGFDHFWRKPYGNLTLRMYRRLLYTSSGFFLLAFSSLLVWLLWRDGRIPTSISFFRTFPFLLLAVIHLTFYLGVLLLVMSLIVRFHQQKSYLYILSGILILVAFFDLRANDRIFINPIPIQGYHNYLFNYEIDSYIKRRADKAPPRLLDTSNVLRMRMIARRIATPHGYHPVGFKRYFDLLERYWFESPEFLRLFKVNYVLTKHPEKFMNLGYKIVKQEGNSVLLSIPEEQMPYVYAPERVQVVKSGQAPATLPEQLNPYRFSAAESDQLASTPGEMIFQNPDEISLNYSVINYSEDEISLRVSARKECYIVISEPNFTGWRAYLDGTKKLHIFTANHLFRMVNIPAGSHIIRFTYRPFSFRLGLYITLLTLFAIISLLTIMKHTTPSTKTLQSN